MTPYRVSLLIASDRAARGERADGVLPALEERLRALGYELGERAILPDEPQQIAAQLRSWADGAACQLILTSGGSGLAPRDQTPEATRQIAEREVPGLMEIARRRCAEITPFAALSRGLAVTRGRCLIINLPGHPKAALETLDALADLLPHALKTLARTPEDCEISGRGGKESA